MGGIEMMREWCENLLEDLQKISNLWIFYPWAFDIFILKDNFNETHTILTQTFTTEFQS